MYLEHKVVLGFGGCKDWLQLVLPKQGQSRDFGQIWPKQDLVEDDSRTVKDSPARILSQPRLDNSARDHHIVRDLHSQQCKSSSQCFMI